MKTIFSLLVWPFLAFLSLPGFAFNLSVELDPAFKQELTQGQYTGRGISLVGTICDPQQINCKRTRPSIMVGIPMDPMEFTVWFNLFQANEYAFRQGFAQNPAAKAYLSINFIEANGQWTSLGCENTYFTKEDNIHLRLSKEGCDIQK